MLARQRRPRTNAARTERVIMVDHSAEASAPPTYPSRPPSPRIAFPATRKRTVARKPGCYRRRIPEEQPMAQEFKPGQIVPESRAPQLVQQPLGLAGALHQFVR